MTNHDYLVQLNSLVHVLCEQILGFKFKAQTSVNETPAIPEEIERLADERMQAKKNKDWAKADALRTEITAKGYVVIDNKTEKGYTLEFKG